MNDYSKNPETKAWHTFQRLQSQLADLIASTAPGEKLPSEPLLAQQLGVSRATLREAMRSFEGQGVIRRRQGVGTFVVGSQHVLDTGLEVLESIEAIAHKIGLNVSMGELNIQERKADAQAAEALQVETGVPVVEISRVIIAENRPVAYLVDTLPEDYLKLDDLKQGFTGSVLDLLLRRGDNLPLGTSLTEIRALGASAEIARALQIQRGDTLLVFVARLFSTSGRVVDYSYSYFLPGYFRFQVVRRVGTQTE